MKDRQAERAPTTGLALVIAAALLVGSAGDAGARQEDVATLRRHVAEQQRKLTAQAEELRRQQDALEQQMRDLAVLAERLAALESDGSERAEAAIATPVAATTPALASAPQPTEGRDPVGDLNAAAVAAGEFPGSVRIPGTQGVSLAVGGFVKSVALADSDLEGTGPIFLPAFIGSARPDRDGNFGFAASLSRLDVEARAPTENGGLRGYVELDLNSNNDRSVRFNVRHAYGSWTSRSGTLTFGHTWSTLMDLQILPEGLTEPTVSGAVFQRQAQLRWTQPLSDRFRFDVALEEPTSRDVVTGTSPPTTSRLPDLIGGAEWSWPARSHLRLTGIARRLEIDDASSTGWGVSAGWHLMLLKSDKLALSATYGEGVGRYLLGLPGAAGGYIDPETSELELLAGRGTFATYRHAWSRRLRSTLAVGEAKVDLVDRAPADAFRRSLFALGNLMFSPYPYLTFGLEYQYGEREDRQGLERDNHRLIFGVQVF